MIAHSPKISDALRRSLDTEMSSSYDSVFSMSDDDSNFSKNSFTLVLDLDETLIHSSFSQPEHYDFDISLQLNKAMYKVYVQVRPGAVEFLKHVCDIFDVYIFTASLQEYSIPVIQKFAPWFPLNKVLSRHHCRVYKNMFVKDISIFQRHLSKVIIVDNSAESFILQPQNGILISSWIGDRKDTALLKEILPVLKRCANSDDARTAISLSYSL